MIILNSQLLDLYAHKHALSKAKIQLLKENLKTGVFRKPQDFVNHMIPKATPINNNRIIFKFKSGERVIIEVTYTEQQCVVVWVGSHEAYDKIDPETVKS
jgi:mRNA interferase HigB